MSNLDYTVWVMNDVVPDNLFYYADYDVQGFLEDKKCFLADYKIGDVLYSDWLIAACKAVNLNPKVILIQLQKEQSIISARAVPPDRVMNRCLGYGMTDAGDEPQFYGFDKQNSCAIADMTKDFIKYKAMSTQPPQLVDNGTLSVLPLNAFTSTSYEYTPWTGSPDSVFSKKWGIHGVYLFWDIWTVYWLSDLKAYTHIG